jgi:hypothetical protein
MKLLLLALTTLVPACTIEPSAQSSERFALTSSTIGGISPALASSARFELIGALELVSPALVDAGHFTVATQNWGFLEALFFSGAKVNDHFLLSFQTRKDKNYTVQYTDSLARSDWQVLARLAGTGTVAVITDEAPIYRERFYRLSED